MTKESLRTKGPTRVWINSPSTLQPYHELHGRRGLAVYEQPQLGTVRVYFTDGPVHSMEVDPLYLSEAS